MLRNRPLCFPFRGTAFKCFALILSRLAFAESQLHFDATTTKIEFERNQGHPLFRHEADQLVNFPAVKEQSPGADGVVIELVAVGVWLNAEALKEHFTIPDFRKTFSEAGLRCTHRFHFGAAQCNPALNILEDKKIPSRLSVSNQNARTGRAV